MGDVSLEAAHHVGFGEPFLLSSHQCSRGCAGPLNSSGGGMSVQQEALPTPLRPTPCGADTQRWRRSHQLSLPEHVVAQRNGTRPHIRWDQTGTLVLSSTASSSHDRSGVSFIVKFASFSTALRKSRGRVSIRLSSRPGSFFRLSARFRGSAPGKGGMRRAPSALLVASYSAR